MKTPHKKIFLALVAAISIAGAQAQNVTFNFDNATQYSPLPVDLTVSGITGHFSSGSSFYNYSIQRADVLGFTPKGFSGLCIYPSTVFASDLLMSFDAQLTFLSVLYAPEEYATDSSCTMRLTAYLGATYVGTVTYSIPVPGTWPSGTIKFSSSQPFDNVVVHYEAPPPTGGDYGPIFMADNVIVTPASLAPTTVVSEKTHGSAGTFDIPMPLTAPSGVENRFGGTGGKFTIVITYPASPTGVTATVTAHDPATATGSVSRVRVSGNSLFVTLTGVSNAQVLTLATSGGTVTPVTVPIGFLIGDMDGNRVVDKTDVNLTKAQLGLPVTDANFRADVKVTGLIDSADVRQVRGQLGTALP